MPNAWGGATPVDSGDAGSYELGNQFEAYTGTIQITALRVWSPPTAGVVTGRTGHIWSTTGTLLASVTMADTLPSGYATYNLTTPLTVNQGQSVIVSYPTGGHYGVVVNALGSGQFSSDGNVYCINSAAGAHGNGSYITTQNSFPTNSSSNDAFYGIDFVYSTGAISGSDTGSGIDNQSLLASESQTDSFSGSDSSLLTANNQSIDFLAGVDIGSIVGSGQSSDTGAFSDGQKLRNIDLDLMSGRESATVVQNINASQKRFIESVKTVIISGFRETFDANYPDQEMQKINVSMEYPSQEVDYPGLWVKFSFSKIQTVGIGSYFVNNTNQMYKQWYFEGRASVQVFAMTSLERDRMSDSIIYLFAFGDLNTLASRFLQSISGNNYISMTINSDQLVPGGQEETVGAPWQPDAIVYNDSYSFNMVGQFASDINTGMLIPLSSYTITPYAIGLQTIPSPFPPNDGLGVWQ